MTEVAAYSNERRCVASAECRFIDIIWHYALYLHPVQWLHRVLNGKFNSSENTEPMADQSSYLDIYAQWQLDPVGFWSRAAEAINWIRPPGRVFNPDSGVYGRWFEGAVCNTCYNCVDRHVEAGNGERTALISDSPVTSSQSSFSFSQVLDETTDLAAVMRKHGVGKGDRVIIYMPMVPQAIFAMLACARLGAIHSVVFGGFAARELATRPRR